MRKQGKELEAQRLSMRTTYDLEMLAQVGVCSGVENYSRHFDGRAPGTPPHTLLDFFPDDFLLVIDEGMQVFDLDATFEQIIGQILGHLLGQRRDERTLVLRHAVLDLREQIVDLPFDRPHLDLRIDQAGRADDLLDPEFLDRVGQTVYLSATPGDYELGLSDGVVEQIIRPTGLVDPHAAG